MLMEYPALSHLSGQDAFGWNSDELSTGTTLVACEFADGVVIGADSRTSLGSLVANRFTDKLTPVTDKIFVCRSGSAADTQAVANVIKYKLDLYKVMMGSDASVKKTAFMFKNVCYEYRDSLSAGLIIAGWDKEEGGQVFSIPIGGMCVRQPVTMGGSGSTYLYGYMSANYREGMNKEQAMDFVSRCVTLAIKRDGSSGGVCRLAAITEAGVERRCILYPDLPSF